MALTIELLGTPRIEVDGAPLAVDTRKATAMLAYLAVSGGVHSRELIADLLWPDAGRDRGRAALRRTLSTLRSALGGRFLVVDRSAVRLDADDDAVDVRRFRALAASAGEGRAAIEPLTRAVALHRDDLLAGFGLRDSITFDDWQRSAAAELRAELELALDRLVAELAAAGRPAEAVPFAQRRLALDRLHEPAHRSLIRLYAASGRRAEALSQYRDCVRVLDRELGVRPLAETSELYDAVNEGRPAAVGGAPAEVVVPAGIVPLVGRETEWRLLAAERESCRGGGRMVVLEGEAGVGKTRLGEELLAAARADGAAAVEARSHEGEAGLPFGLVAAALRGALEAAGPEPLAAVPDHWRSEAARLVPEAGGAAGPAEADGVAAQQRLHEGLAQVLGALLAGDPAGVLFLDDLQFADAASLGLVAYLTRRLVERPMLIVAAWRPEEAGPALTPLRRQATRIVRLGRLGRDDVAVLAGEAGMGEQADRLFAETEGLPLFVVEYLAALGADPDAGDLPGGVRELLASRLDRVGEAATQLLAAAAVIGRSFDLETLRAASGRGDEETVAGVEELTRRGLIAEHEAGYDFSHEKLLGLVQARTSLARTRLLHRRVAEALAARRGDPALIGRHLQAAGRDDEAAQAFREAGDRARALHAYAEALDAYRSALALGSDNTAALHESIGDLHTLRGEYPSALAGYEAAAALADPADVARIEHKLGRVHDRRGDPVLAERHLAEALRLGGESARVEADRSLTAHRRGDDAEAVELAGRALELAEERDDAEAVAQTHNILGMLTGDAAHLERSAELAERLPDRSVLVAALNNLALARARDGDADAAIALFERALAICREQGDRHREAALRNNLADVNHRAGREEASMAHLKEAVAIFAEVGGQQGEMQPEIWKLVEW